MPLNNAPVFSGESLTINPVYSGIVQQITPSDFNLAHNLLFPKQSYSSAGNGTGWYYRYNLADSLRKLDDLDLIRRPGAPAKAITRGRSIETFRVKRRHLDAIVVEDDARLISAQTGGKIDPHVSEIAWVRELLLLQKEFRAAELANANSSVGYHAAPSYKWDNYSSSDPVQDISDLKGTVRNRCGMIPNAMALPWTVAQKLANHPKIRSLRAYTERQAINAEALEALLKDVLALEKVVVFNAMYESSRPSETPSTNLMDIWGDNIYLYVSKDYGFDKLCWGLEPVDTFYNGEFSVGVYPIPDVDAESTKYRVKEDSDFLIFNPELCARIEDVLT